MNFKIDKEFRELISPLTESEYSGLEDSILEKGCISPLIVWKEEIILIDGHHRYEICKKHNIPYEVKEVSFTDRDEVIFWMVTNQMKRRNLTKGQKALSVLKLRPIFERRAIEKKKKAMAKARAKNEKVDSEFLFCATLHKTETQAPVDTKKELAKLAGIGERTMSKVLYIEKNASDLLGMIQEGESVERIYKSLKAPHSKILYKGKWFEVDAEIRELLPPLTESEYSGLEKLILEDGCMTAIIVSCGFLVDGYARLEICKKHGISYEVREVFPSEKEKEELLQAVGGGLWDKGLDKIYAKMRRLKSAFIRRNLNEMQRGLMMLQRKEIEEKEKEGV